MQTPSKIYAQISRKGRGDFVFTSDHQKVLHAGTDYMLHFLDAATLDEISTSDISSEIFAMAELHQQHSILMGGASMGVEILLESDLTQKASLIQTASRILSIEANPDNSVIALSTEEPFAYLINTSNDQKIKLIPGHQGSVVSVLLHPTLSIAASISTDGCLNVYSYFFGEELGKNSSLKESFRVSANQATSLEVILKMSWGSNGQKILVPGKEILQMVSLETSSNESEGESRDFRLRHEAEPMISHSGVISCVESFKNNQRYIVTSGAEKAIKIWDFLAKTIVQSFLATEQIVRLRTNAEKLYALDFSGGMALWEKCIPSQDSAEPSGPVIKPRETMEEEKQESGPQKEPVQQVSASSKELHGAEVNKVTRGPVIIDELLPQNVLYSSSTHIDQNGKRLLKWNLVGAVIERRYGDGNSVIDVEFADKNFHKPVSIQNQMNLSMACLDTQGLLLASSPRKINMDEYLGDEEEEDDSNHRSALCFRKWGMKGKEDSKWTIKFGFEQEDNVIENIALGRWFIAAYLTSGVLRVINFAGIEIASLCLCKPVVTIEAFESQLALVFHSGMPVLGFQNISYEIFSIGLSGGNDINVPLEKKEEGKVPISSNEELRWVGFSNEGMLLVQESSWRVILKIGEDIWAPMSIESEKIWILGMMEYEVYGVKLKADQMYPPSLNKAMHSVIPVAIASLKSQEDELQTKCDSVVWKRIQVKNEKRRKEAFGSLKGVVPDGDPSLLSFGRMMTEAQINEKRACLEKELIYLFRECLVKEDIPKAQSIIYLMEHPKTLEMALTVLRQMNYLGLVEEFKEDVVRRGKMLKNREASSKEKVVFVESASANGNPGTFKPDYSSVRMETHYSRTNEEEERPTEKMRMIDLIIGSIQKSEQPSPLNKSPFIDKKKALDNKAKGTPNMEPKPKENISLLRNKPSSGFGSLLDELKGTQKIKKS